MEPFNITAPEDIAKEYGGDKRRIAQAAQMGLIDSTSAVMAGMFIDRMRNAAQTEQAPQQTVAEATFAPQAPMQPPAPGGLGSTPQAAQMGGMPQQMPPQQMPPQQPMPQMAEGGLLMLSLPDDDYAAGGLVSFADGGDQRRAQQRALIEVLQSPNTSPEQRRMAQIELERLAKEAPAVPPSSRVDPDVAGLAGVSAPPQMGMAAALQQGLDQGAETFAEGVVPRGFTMGQGDVLNQGMETFAESPSLPTGREGNRFDTGTLTEEEAKRISAARAIPDRGDVFGAVGTEVSEAGLGAIVPRRAESAIDMKRPSSEIDRRGSLAEQIARMQASAAPSSGGRRITDPAEIERLIASTQAPAVPPAAPPAVPPAVPPAATPVAPPATTPEIPKQDVKSIEEYFTELSAIRPAEKGPYTQELEQMLASRGAALSDAKKEALNMALLQTGLGMLSQAGGQTALQALGAAALPATKVAADAIKEAKKEDRDLLKMGAAIEQAEGKRKDALLDAAVKKHGADKTAAATLEAARLNAERETDLSRQINILVNGAKAADRVMGKELRSDAEYAQDALREIQQQQIDVAKAGATVSAAARLPGQELELAKAREAVIQQVNEEFTDPVRVGDIRRRAEEQGTTVEALKQAELARRLSPFGGQTAAPSAPAGGTKPAPKVGDVSQGYRFKGGDPANPSNWEKI